jgi:dihydroneopterin aldolase
MPAEAHMSDPIVIDSYGWIHLSGVDVDVSLPRGDGLGRAPVTLTFDIELMRPLEAAIGETADTGDTFDARGGVKIIRDTLAAGSFTLVEQAAGAVGKALFEADTAARRVRISVAATPVGVEGLGSMKVKVDLRRGDGRPPWKRDESGRWGSNESNDRDDRGGRGGPRRDDRGGPRGDNRGGPRGDNRGGPRRRD